MRTLSTYHQFDEGAKILAEADTRTLSIGERLFADSTTLCDCVSFVFPSAVPHSKLQRIAEAINQILAEPVAAPLSVAAE